MTDQMVARIERALSTAWSTPVCVRSIEELAAHNSLFRCHLSTAAPHRSIIAKFVTRAEFTSKIGGVSGRFLNELAVLEFLEAEIETVEAPRLLAVDRHGGMMILMDLGHAPSVLDVIQSVAPGDATNSLTAMGTSLGILQRATRGRESELAQRRRALQVDPPRSDSTVDLRTIAGVAQRQIAWQAFELDERFYRDIEQVEAAIHDDPTLRRFLHADAGPQNGLLVGNTVVFLDFEFATYGHGLLDVVSARLGFPHSANAATVPLSDVEALESAYRNALDDDDELADLDLFSAAMVDACAHWALVRWLGLIERCYLPALATPAQLTDDEKTALSQSLTVLHGFTVAAKAASRRLNLAQTIDRVIVTMRSGVPGMDIAAPFAAFANEDGEA